MKYLLVFYFAGFFLADAVQIKKYKLRLEPKEKEFQGTVTLTLSESNGGGDVQLDPYEYEVTTCTYTGIDLPVNQLSELENSDATEPPEVTSVEPPKVTSVEPPEVTSTEPPEVTSTEPPEVTSTEPPKVTSTEPPKVTSTEPPKVTSTEPPKVTSTEPPKVTSTEPPKAQSQNCTVEDNKIKFHAKRTGEEVVLQFKGRYNDNGLSEYKTDSGKRFYVADMTAKRNKIIFPCRGELKAKFEFEGDNVVMSNLENLRKKDEKEEVFIRNLTFVQGDIDKDDKTIESFPYYHIKGTNKIGQKLKNVMEKVAELDPSLKILFTPVNMNIKIISRDVIILSNVDLNSDDPGPDYFRISQELARKLFQRPEGEKKTFFDRVGPEFTAMKISGVTGFPFEGYLKLWQSMALEEDGFNNSRSLNELASKYEDIWMNKVFYPKGVSVLYSLESKCGDGKFTKGLSKYMRNGNSKVNEAFEECFDNKEKAKEFFKVWTDDPGYPVVHVTLNKPTQYSMTQERFLWFGSEQKDRRWIIPTDYKTKEGSRKNITLSTTENVTETINSTYFILDQNNTGFFRVNYDAKLWEALISQLKSNHTVIDPVSRMKLIDDVFSFPRSTYKFAHGIPDYVTALKLSEYLKNETDFRALIRAFDAVRFLDSALGSSYHGKFRDHMKGILNGIYNQITKIHSGFHSKVTLLACKFGVEECIKNATATFSEIKLNATALTKKEQLAICSVIRNDSTKWMDSFALLGTMDISSKDKNFMLGCSRDEKILSLFLTQFIAQKDKEGFKEAVGYAMDHNPDNMKVILDIIKRFEDAIKKAFGKEYLQEIVRLILPKLNSESAAVTLKEIAKNLNESLTKDVNTVCENVKLWTNTKAKSVGEYFKGSGSQAKPIALVLLATTLLPLANHIFHS